MTPSNTCLYNAREYYITNINHSDTKCNYQTDQDLHSFGNIEIKLQLAVQVNLHKIPPIKCRMS